MPCAGVTFLSRALQNCNIRRARLRLGCAAIRSLPSGMPLLRIGFWFLAAALGAGCGRHETRVEEGIRTHTLLVGNGAEPADLDPHVVALFTDQRVQLALFEGLAAFDEKTARAVPAAAEGWD